MVDQPLQPGAGGPPTVDHGELWTVARASARLGLDADLLQQPFIAEWLLAVPAPDGTLRYPSWQFDEALRPLIEPVVFALRRQSPDEVRRFFEQPQSELRGRTALQALQDGDHARVLEIAETRAAQPTSHASPADPAARR